MKNKIACLILVSCSCAKSDDRTELIPRLRDLSWMVGTYRIDTSGANAWDGKVSIKPVSGGRSLQITHLTPDGRIQVQRIYVSLDAIYCRISGSDPGSSSDAGEAKSNIAIEDCGFYTIVRSSTDKEEWICSGSFESEISAPATGSDKTRPLHFRFAQADDGTILIKNSLTNAIWDVVRLHRVPNGAELIDEMKELNWLIGEYKGSGVVSNLKIFPNLAGTELEAHYSFHLPDLNGVGYDARERIFFDAADKTIKSTYTVSRSSDGRHHQFVRAANSILEGTGGYPIKGFQAGAWKGEVTFKNRRDGSIRIKCELQRTERGFKFERRGPYRSHILSFEKVNSSQPKW